MAYPVMGARCAVRCPREARDIPVKKAESGLIRTGGRPQLLDTTRRRKCDLRAKESSENPHCRHGSSYRSRVPEASMEPKPQMGYPGCCAPCLGGD